MRNILRLKKQTRHTAVFETDDPLSPVTTLYVQKSWLAAHNTELDQEIVPELIGVEISRLPQGKGKGRGDEQ